MRRGFDSRAQEPIGSRCLGRGWRLIIVAVLAILVLAALAGCSKSTKPKDVKYNIYLGVSNRIYIYDADSLILLDSILRDHRAEEIAASPDGRFLYVVDRLDNDPHSRLEKIDLQTKQVMWSRSNEDVGGQSQIRLLAGGGLVFMGNAVLRPEDGSLLRRFGDSLLTMYGPESGSRVAAFQDSVVTIIDAATGESSGRLVPRLSNGLVLDMLHIRLHPDGRRVIGLGFHGDVDSAWCIAGDLATGETLFELPLGQPWGEVGMSDDGTVAVVTDPRGEWGAAQTLKVINLENLTVVRACTDELAFQSQVSFLPDNRHAVLSPPSNDNHSRALQILDVLRMGYLTTVLPPLNGQVVGGLAVGPRL